jgi:RNA polymerase sigma-70 factor (ECF subfamily)
MAENMDDFSALWLKAESSLLAYLRMFIPFQDARDDLAQDIALIAFRKFDTFDSSKASFATWIRGIAKFEVLNSRRKFATSKVTFNSDTVDKLTVAYEEEEEATGNEYMKILKECLNDLDEDQRELLMLKYEGGLSSDEIAEKTGLTSVNVRVKLNRLREKLKGMLKTRGIESAL